MTMPDMHCLVSLLVLCGSCIVPQMAAWRREHDDTVRQVVNEIRAALRAANLLSKEVAAELDMAVSQFSLDLSRGWNIAAFVVLGRRFPVLGAALWNRIGELLVTEEPLAQRRERLLSELYSLPQKRDVKKCSVRTRSVSESSAA
jgi:hypothetical protein